MTVWLPDTSKIYYCRFTVEGRQLRGSTGKTNIVEARAFERDWRRDEERKLLALGSVKVPVAHRDMNLLAAANKFIAETKPKRAQEAETKWDWLVEQIGPMTRLADIDDRLVNELCQLMSQRHPYDDPERETLADATVNSNVVKPLSTMLDRARSIWQVPLPCFPNFKLHRREEKPRTRELWLHEELAMEAEAGDLWPIIDFAIKSGLRRAEMLIRKKDVIWETNRIKVRTKGGKEREIVITDGIRRILEENWHRHPEYVFTVREGRHVIGRDLPPRTADMGAVPLTGVRLYTEYKRVAALAKVENITIHDLRRTAGARMYRSQHDIKAVSKFLGHANVQVTERHYVHIVLDDVVEQIQAAEAMNELKKSQLRERLAA